MNKFIFAACAVVIPAAHAFADPFSWITWDSFAGTTAFGTINTTGGPVGVQLDGPFNTILSGYPSWTPASTYADGVIVDNSPDNESLVKINTLGHFTLSFSQQVDNLAFSVWSAGQSGQPVTYAFDQNLSFVSGGPGLEYGGTSITNTSNTVTGVEGNGTVLFGGSFSSLSFDVLDVENYHGFTIGLKSAQAVPEPASMAVIGLGVLALARRRRKSA